ncbi:MAG: hypothetical protein AB7K09_14990 [Planctomycetota bacterium]
MTWQQGTVVVPTAEPETAEAETTGSGSSSSSSDAKPANPMGAWEKARAKNKDTAVETIDKIAEGVDGNQLMVLFVYTESEDRKFARATEASKTFEAEVLGSFDVATALQGTRNVRLNGEELSREVKKTYGIANGAPQIILIDPTGKVLFKGNAGTSAAVLVKMIESAREHVDKLVAKRDEAK